MMTRIIAGLAKGRRLRVPDGQSVRPTADRVRESLFNILGSIDGNIVLDLFAGSGALGIEALSRGAGFTLFIEQSLTTWRIAKQNIEMCGFLDQAEIWKTDALRALKKIKQQEKKFDLVFLDPPYNSNYLGNIMESTILLDITKPETRIIAEHSLKRQPEPVEYWDIVDSRKYGTTGITIFTKH